MLELMGTLKKELENNIIDFQGLLMDYTHSEEEGYEYSFDDYEKRINQSLDLQMKASYITSLVYRLMNVTKPLFKKTQAGSKEYMRVKSTYDELSSHLDYYKNHVYNFSQKAKTLSMLLNSKQMANPDIHRY